MIWHAKKYEAEVTQVKWLSNTLFTVSFIPEADFRYIAGQFVSLEIPIGRGQKLKRCYSLASSYRTAKSQGYSICVKLVPGGKGSNYLASLKPGDKISLLGAYGELVFRAPKRRRGICLIGTGSGIGLLKAIAEEARDLGPKEFPVIAFLGARHEDECIYNEEFKKLGVQLHYAVSQPTKDWKGFKGRVTDLIQTVKPIWKLQEMDYYLCGNGEMIHDVKQLLMIVCGVPLNQIHAESFTVPAKEKSEALVRIAS